MAGGILWLIIVSFVIIGAVIRYHRNKKAATSAAVQLSDIRSGATEAEALPDAPSKTLLERGRE
jgi:cytochrome c-type biogenesis protein CcmH/NrfF